MEQGIPSVMELLNRRSLQSQMYVYNICNVSNWNALMLNDVCCLRCQVDISDSAMFDCLAVNSLGSVSSSGELRVLAFAPNFQKNPMVPVLGMVGQSAVMTCQPEAAPDPTITWFFQDVSITPGTSTMDQNTGEPTVSLSGPREFQSLRSLRVNVESKSLYCVLVCNDLLHIAKWKPAHISTDENARGFVRMPSSESIRNGKHLGLFDRY